MSLPPRGRWLAKQDGRSLRTIGFAQKYYARILLHPLRGSPLPEGAFRDAETSSPTREMEFVRGGFCRKENFVCVVGVDVLGDPCDQRDRSTVGVGKES